ncbi:MAG: SDR family NAD(P)-dependent oxidoreductase [Ignavibacteria bacterium]|nr:SDR family NAD(P)-dependent oxidoreductase [Ignavibacteria bacterium]
MNIFITGISRGLGKELALHYTGLGHKVFGFSRSALDNQKNENKKLIDSKNFKYYTGSINIDSDASAAIEEAIKFMGSIDVLINNAAYKLFKLPDEITAEEYRESIDTNLTSQIILCNKVIPHLIKNGGGKIINMSSNAGMVSYEGGTSYCTSKAGFISYSLSLAKYLKDKKISVNVISPPTFSTGDYRTTRPEINHTKLLQSEKVIKLIDYIVFSKKFITGKNFPMFKLKTLIKYSVLKQIEFLDYLFQFRLK